MSTIPPEKPHSSYMQWLNANREEIKKQNPELGFIDFSKKAGEMWNALEDKTEWDKKAAEERRAYDKVMEDYITQQAGSTEEEKESSEDWESVLSLRKRKIPKKSPSELASEKQAEPGTNYKSKEYASQSEESSGSGSEDKPLKKKSKKDEDSKEN
ncbi:high mobility group protein Z-like [Saccostrea echinata]|uniref:high mobility group protein Z-like n=1 Tax=Saccostrea echinata TaxID=191078 RepID=UPI002A83CF58|nr:high mobility group protein Z-like [Saccostrea echinata]